VPALAGSDALRSFLHAAENCEQLDERLGINKAVDVYRRRRFPTFVEAGPDFPGVLPADPTLAIQSKTTRVGNPELPRYIAGYACRHISRIIQESAQEPYGAELDGEAQTHMIPTFGRS
jgi:hypothetical protein